MLIGHLKPCIKPPAAPSASRSPYDMIDCPLRLNSWASRNWHVKAGRSSSEAAHLLPKCKIGVRRNEDHAIKPGPISQPKIRAALQLLMPWNLCPLIGNKKRPSSVSRRASFRPGACIRSGLFRGDATPPGFILGPAGGAVVAANPAIRARSGSQELRSNLFVDIDA